MQAEALDEKLEKEVAHEKRQDKQEEEAEEKKEEEGRRKGGAKIGEGLYSTRTALTGRKCLFCADRKTTKTIHNTHNMQRPN